MHMDDRDARSPSPDADLSVVDVLSALVIDCKSECVDREIDGKGNTIASVRDSRELEGDFGSATKERESANRLLALPLCSIPATIAHQIISEE